jgi:beta-glucosidase
MVQSGAVDREQFELSSRLSKSDVHPRAVFAEGLAIDYKWFDKYGIEPRYEFGYGLR